jgi:cell division control protein 45
MDTYKYAEKLEVFKDDRARLNVNRNEDGSLQTTNVVIKSEDEYRFMMFRHWSLYDSMYHSGYVSSKLGVWKDAGKKRLNNMFAKMGYVYTHRIILYINIISVSHFNNANKYIPTWIWI